MAEKRKLALRSAVWAFDSGVMSRTGAAVPSGSGRIVFEASAGRARDSSRRSDVPQEMLELQASLDAQAFRTFTIQITNSSGTLLVLQDFTLTGGSWAQRPQAGSPINSGQTASYDNYTDQAFTGLGGTMTLVPANGGTIALAWNWAWGGVATGSATASGLTGISVSAQVINGNTNNPTLQITVSNKPAS
jgi:hypothetical protein